MFEPLLESIGLAGKGHYLGSALLLACAVALVIDAMMRGNKVLLIWFTPRTSCGDAEQGKRIEVHGQVSLQSELVEAPLTKTPCVYYAFKAEKYRRPATRKGRSNYWEEVLRVNDQGRCLVEDETGIVEVDLTGADTYVTPHEVSSGLVTIDPVLQRMFLTRRKTCHDFYEDARLTETVILPDEPVYVFGEVYGRSEEGYPRIVADGNNLLIVGTGTEKQVLSDVMYRITGELLAAMGFAASSWGAFTQLGP